ncbi:MAG: MBL fold metallo-hydrolase, partial [Lachnospiraceae bacterium]|nr:MBL fold metallo-hydrolase [Lachnospiraceae bacterium]
TGDAEEKAEEDMLENGLDLHADVYQAGHHGSRTSSKEEFLDEVAPVYAVISCAEGNSYGHPHAATLNKFRERGIQVFRTDEQGSIVAVSDGTTITWNCAPSDTWKAGEPTGSGR